MEDREEVSKQIEAIQYLMQRSKEKENAELSDVVSEPIEKIIKSSQAGFVGDRDEIRIKHFKYLKSIVDKISAYKRDIVRGYEKGMFTERRKDRMVGTLERFLRRNINQIMIQSQTSKNIPDKLSSVLVEHSDVDIPTVPPEEGVNDSEDSG